MRVIEKGFTFLFTGTTHVLIVPLLVLFAVNRKYYQLSVTIFTLVCSFFYHSLNSFEVDELILSELQWHRLDNIGSVVTFITLVVSLMAHPDPQTEALFNYFGFFLGIIFQEKDPWDIRNTVYPVLIYILIWIFSILKRKKFPTYNKKMLALGLLSMVLACVFFWRGLDDRNDYYRFHHGLWHVFVVMGLFHLFQASTPPGSVTFSILDIVLLRFRKSSYSQMTELNKSKNLETNEAVSSRPQEVEKPKQEDHLKLECSA